MSETFGDEDLELKTLTRFYENRRHYMLSIERNLIEDRKFLEEARASGADTEIWEYLVSSNEELLKDARDAVEEARKAVAARAGFRFVSPTHS